MKVRKTHGGTVKRSKSEVHGGKLKRRKSEVHGGTIKIKSGAWRDSKNKVRRMKEK